MIIIFIILIILVIAIMLAFMNVNEKISTTLADDVYLYKIRKPRNYYL